ncbi:MAG: LacI family DNA-binding transcriptional regulator [Treponema sp.]|nr:LacI family DNA-binding transcriptional regulator [Treponema sp.]
MAGVSRATVSRVINNYAYVKHGTREKVLKVIEQHSYAPHFSARILAGKRSNTIGLFFLPARTFLRGAVLKTPM